jgi:NAD(P)-dependent dehydrogenase (short-subunit alcohol dehydrogenase family)
VVARNLQGARVLITGASSGIGLATARAFAREGADVALLARRREGLERAAEMVRGHGGRALVVPADVADQQQVNDAVARVTDAWGGLDVVVSNAAGPVFGPFTEVEQRDFDRTVQVTFLGSVNVIRATLGVLREHHGTLVQVGSILSREPMPTYAAYAAAKHAVRGFINSLRIELRAQRIDVPISLVHPGPVNSPFWRHGNSAVGHRPRFPPEGYKPAVIARVLVSVAREPRAEVTIGGEGKLIELLYRAVPKLGELYLTLAYHWYMSGRRPAQRPNVLWEPAGEGQEEDGPMLGRPSLWAPIRLRVRAPRALVRRP